MQDEKPAPDATPPTTEPQTNTPAPKPELPPNSPKPVVVVSKPRWKMFAIVALPVIVVLLVLGYFWWHGHKSKPAPAITTTTKSSTQKTTSSTSSTAQGLQLDTSKNYGNKYADGVLPVGDGKYTTTSAKQGYVYACSQYAQNLASDSGGAMTRGPWFTDNNTEYDANKKLHVEGSVTWNGKFTDVVSGATRTITSNNLPLSDPTGIFPIQSTDPAYAYDRNPNTIQAQNFTYAISADPTYSSTPNCESGQVGVMLTGVALFNALDAGGRDAGAWEVQDECDGHPQSDGIYHYHTLSSCIKDTSVHTVIGFALDGFPITGPQVNGSSDVLTTSDLDACRGR